MCWAMLLLEALDNTGLAHAKKDGRCALLWQKLQAYDNGNHMRHQLQNLSLSMLKPVGKPPTSQGNACKTDA